jgi:hypothetical protein
MDSIDLSDIRMVLAPHELERIGRFRYAVYVEEQGKRTAHADHEARTLIEPEDHNWATRTYWVERGGEILGTVRTQRGPFPALMAEQMQLDRLPFGGQPNLVLFSRLLISPAARRTDVISKILIAGVAMTAGNGLIAGVHTCKPELAPVFETFGCSAYAAPFVHDEAGPQQPMALLCEGEYLRRRGSPLASWLETFKPASPHTDDFLALVESHRRETGRDIACPASRLAAPNHLPAAHHGRAMASNDANPEHAIGDRP